MYILHDWKLQHSFNITGFDHQFLKFSFLVDNQLYFFMWDRSIAETGLYTLDIKNGIIKKLFTFGDSWIWLNYADKQKLKIYAIADDYMLGCFWVEIDLLTNSYSEREIPCMVMCIISKNY